MRWDRHGRCAASASRPSISRAALRAGSCARSTARRWPDHRRPRMSGCPRRRMPAGAAPTSAARCAGCASSRLTPGVRAIQARTPSAASRECAEQKLVHRFAEVGPNARQRDGDEKECQRRSTPTGAAKASRTERPNGSNAPCARTSLPAGNAKVLCRSTCGHLNMGCKQASKFCLWIPITYYLPNGRKRVRRNRGTCGTPQASHAGMRSSPISSS